MPLQRRVNGAVFYYMDDLGSRIVARTGKPSDRHHLGQLVLQGLKDDPDFVLQIDGVTGESETAGSVLERSVRFAMSLRKLGLKKGDVMMILAPNHLDVTIALYAGLYLGIIVCAVSPLTAVSDLKVFISTSKPSIILCQSEGASRAQMISLDLKLNPHIITFDKGDFLNYIDFMEMYKDDTPIEDFKCTDFDPEQTVAFIVNTSGTTGPPKAIAHSHKYFAILLPYLWCGYTQFPVPTRLVLVVSQLEWISGMTSFIRTAVLRYTRLQASKTLSPEELSDLINKYKPSHIKCTPTLMTTLIQLNKTDFTCTEEIIVGGHPVPQYLIEEIKSISPNTEVTISFGMSELTGLAFFADHPAPGSCGKPMSCYQYRLYDIDTQEEIHKPNVQGELWIKGPAPFMGCYNNPEANKNYLTKDGWLKTGDIFYYDENGNYYWVDKIKLQIKYFRYRMSPLEIEGVIRRHPGVLDVAVTCIEHSEWGDLPVACVVPRPGATPSAEEIKNFVKDSLRDEMQLRGGVIFLDSIPMTASTKVHRRRLRQLALELPRA